MKKVSQNLINMLSGDNKFICCDLYTITLMNAIVLRFTSADIPIYYDGAYYDNTLLIKRDSLDFKAGINVDTLNLAFYPKQTNLIGGLTYQKAFRNGTFDGAILQLDKAFFTDWKQPPEVLKKLFIGQLEVEDVGKSEIKAVVNSLTQLLNISLPKMVYQAPCPWRLYDGHTCKLVKANHTSQGIVNNVSTITTVNCNLPQQPTYFDQGVILFTSGYNINIKRSIKSHLGGKLIMSNPLQYPPNMGDTFEVTRGCDGTISQCTGKFNNAANFGGQPFVPEACSSY